MLANNACESQNRIFRVFKRKNKIVYLHSISVPALPSSPYANFKLFGSTINGNIVLGVFAKSPAVTYRHKFDCKSVIFESIKDKTRGLRWVEVNSQQERNKETTYFYHDCHYISSVCIQAKVGYTLLLYNSLPRFVYGFDRMIIMNFTFKSHNRISYLRKIPLFGNYLHVSKSSRPSCLTYSAESAYRPLDSNGMIGFNITQIGDNSILLVGGMDEFNKPNLVFWQGSFAESRFSTLCWVPIELPSVTPRFRPLCFKLCDNLYISGGLSIESDCSKDGEDLFCCDKYDLKEGKYYKNVYCLPYPLSSANKVVTNTDETYALIIANKNQSLGSTHQDLRGVTSYITFKQEAGFVELTGVEFDEDLADLKINLFETTLFRIK
jgi:hypothetical protein